MLRTILLGAVLLSQGVLAYPQDFFLSHDGDAFEKIVGVEDYGRLSGRLAAVNADIQKKGLHDFSQSQGKLLTGYEYGEFYDWDLYFENIYLSYYGVNQ